MLSAFWLMKDRDFESTLLVYSNLPLCESLSPPKTCHLPPSSYSHGYLSNPIPHPWTILCIYFDISTLQLIFPQPWELIKGSTPSEMKKKKLYPQTTRDPAHCWSLCRSREVRTMVPFKGWHGSSCVEISHHQVQMQVWSLGDWGWRWYRTELKVEALLPKKVFQYRTLSVRI